MTCEASPSVIGRRGGVQLPHQINKSIHDDDGWLTVGSARPGNQRTAVAAPHPEENPVMNYPDGCASSVPQNQDGATASLRTLSGNHALLHRNYGTNTEFVCHYCGRKCWCNCVLSAAYKTGDLIELDHVVPSSRGGGDDPWNTVSACGPCNGSKNYRIYPDEWFPDHVNRTWILECSVEALAGDSLLTRGTIAYLGDLLGHGHVRLQEAAAALKETDVELLRRLNWLYNRERLDLNVIKTGPGPADYQHVFVRAGTAAPEILDISAEGWAK